MSGFSAEWLQFREPVDHAARSEAIMSAVAHYFLNEPVLKITDIGCGTGSTVRALEPFLSQAINWHLIDNDAQLVSKGQAALNGDNISYSIADLSISLDPVFSQDASLVTTSAFLDLVSETWLRELVAAITSRNIPFYAALTYDGRSGCEPQHHADSDIQDCFNRHQNTDKGFGPALGPDAASTALRLFREAGYQIVSENSDWVARNNHPEFQELLVEGWHLAACAVNPDEKDRFDDWLSARRKAIASGTHSLFVGHVDFFAAPKP